MDENKEKSHLELSIKEKLIKHYVINCELNNDMAELTAKFIINNLDGLVGLAIIDKACGDFEKEMGTKRNVKNCGKMSLPKSPDYDPSEPTTNEA